MVFQIWMNWRAEPIRLFLTDKASAAVKQHFSALFVAVRLQAEFFTVNKIAI